MSKSNLNPTRPTATRGRRVHVALVSLGAGAMLAGCNTFGGPVQEEPTPEQLQIRALETKLDRLDQRLENMNMVGVAQQTDQVASEIADLRGQVENLSFEIENAKRRERQLYLDLDKRLQAVEQGGGGGALAAPRAGGVGAASADVESASPDAQAAYNAAFAKLRAGDYAAAVPAFEAFVDDHGDSSYADNAQYWLGETHYVTKDFAKARSAFEALVRDYEDSPKVPDALLKLGYIADEQRDYARAKQSLGLLISEYPDSNAAGLAQTRLDRIRAAGN